MLPPANRLRRDNDIKRVLGSKTGVYDTVAGLKYVKNGSDASRFAVVVPNKVTKIAVKRNAVRRQYREIFRLHLAEIAPGFDVILLVGKPALDLAFDEKASRLLRNLRKAKLIA